MQEHLKQYAIITKYAVPAAPPTLVVNLRRVSHLKEGHKGESCWLYIGGRQEHVAAPFTEVRDAWLAANGDAQ